MKKIIIVLLLLCSIHFWRFYIFPQKFHNLTDLVSLLILGISLFSVIQFKGLRFKNAIVLFLIGILFNILSAYLNNGQRLMDSFLSFGPFYFIMFYFFLHEYKIALKDVENLIIIFACLYAGFYLIQIAAYPTRIFGGNMFADRGTIRIRIEGSGFLMLGYFLFLNRYLTKRKLIHIILALFFFIILLKGGFRTLTAGAVLMSGVIFLRLVKYSVQNYFMILLAVIGFLVLLQFEGTSTILDGMISASEEQQEQGEQYIRVMQLNYFSNVYPQNFSYYIFGGGLPGGKGGYASRMGYLTQEYGFYWVDLGLIGFYFVIGLITTLGLLWYALKASFIKVPIDRIYLNVYFGYLVLVSFTTMEIFRSGMFVVEAIALYLIDISRDEMLVSKTNQIREKLNGGGNDL